MAWCSENGLQLNVSKTIIKKAQRLSVPAGKTWPKSSHSGPVLPGGDQECSDIFSHWFGSTTQKQKIQLDK